MECCSRLQRPGLGAMAVLCAHIDKRLHDTRELKRRGEQGLVCRGEPDIRLLGRHQALPEPCSRFRGRIAPAIGRKYTYPKMHRCGEPLALRLSWKAVEISHLACDGHSPRKPRRMAGRPISAFPRPALLRDVSQYCGAESPIRLRSRALISTEMLSSRRQGE